MHQPLCIRKPNHMTYPVTPIPEASCSLTVPSSLMPVARMSDVAEQMKLMTCSSSGQSAMVIICRGKLKPESLPLSCPLASAARILPSRPSPILIARLLKHTSPSLNSPYHKRSSSVCDRTVFVRTWYENAQPCGVPVRLSACSGN